MPRGRAGGKRRGGHGCFRNLKTVLELSHIAGRHTHTREEDIKSRWPNVGSGMFHFTKGPSRIGRGGTTRLPRHGRLWQRSPEAPSILGSLLGADLVSVAA